MKGHCYHCGQLGHVAQFCQYAVYTGIDLNGSIYHQRGISIQPNSPQSPDMLYPLFPQISYIDPGHDNKYYPSYYSMPTRPGLPSSSTDFYGNNFGFQTPEHKVVICHSCGARGHRNRECPTFPAKTCHACGKTGHIVSRKRLCS